MYITIRNYPGTKMAQVGLHALVSHRSILEAGAVPTSGFIYQKVHLSTGEV